MSTCKGSPAPHRCSHGLDCDWEAPVYDDPLIRLLNQGPYTHPKKDITFQVAGVYIPPEEFTVPSKQAASRAWHEKHPAGVYGAIWKIEELWKVGIR